MAGLVLSDRKSKVTQIAFICGEQQKHCSKQSLRWMGYKSRGPHHCQSQNTILIMILHRLCQCCIITILKRSWLYKKPSEINKCSIVKVIVGICWSWESLSWMICHWRQGCLRKDELLNHQGPSSLVFLFLLPHTSSHCWIKDYLHIWKSIEMGHGTIRCEMGQFVIKAWQTNCVQF